MNHATFDVGEVLYDIVHNRQVRILEHVENPEKVFVQAIVGPDSYTIEKKYLFTGDEINRALGRTDAREDLQDSREYRREHVS